MKAFSSLLFAGVAAAVPTGQAADADAPAATVKCPIVFDGRVPSTLVLTDFDSYSKGSPFNAEYVKGNDLKWSEILLLPSVPTSRFDAAVNTSGAAAFKALEVTLSDKSIFQKQNGFRRAGLQLNGDTNTGSPGFTGIKTLHFSVKQDAQRPLNLSHEYLNVWHEASDYSADQIMFQAGTLIDQAGLPKNTFKVMSRQNKQLWSTPISTTDWQNFAFTLDFNKNTVQVYYSKGTDPLASVLKATADDLSGAGQFQIGILKKPTGTSDVVNSGFQESGLKEGQIYGGIFIEDSANGCISL
ncbi:uncharacterized protein SPSK_04444 [Sporothrix schenckii 1099-18]|uniref:Glycoside hydrolase 131 catalytic N-terminal domain-containing protein n=2 Tax=Sporothrix schenckii TaxID=29908 RepID=U7PVM1_SPOS1|nr:uncharacterized protein SPSK_04444 [Sporothrix schenckii 1099-18]ERS98961.1 hypothetical protein HMPREF1624_04156 [Sporothrix schenckii ATCC 58251]KJR83396.1 hypothetical protein SPSK_04444 [Sporothrix schenckii 1099-18]